MIVRNVQTTNIWAASGTRNFFGDGWWYHRFYGFLFPGFKDLYKCTWVAKTATLNARPGNMPLDRNLQPKALLPGCIKLFPFKGAVLNAVGLSGPGIVELLIAGKWQKNELIVISFMAVENTPSKRLEETREFVRLLQLYRGEFNKIIIQYNKSCPNTGHKTKEFEEETIRALEILAELDMPIDLKVNVLFDNAILKIISDRKLCDIITVSNTIPFGECDDDIDWEGLFGEKSPLSKYGGGGLSGKPIFRLVIKKIRRMKADSITTPIKGGGGIMRPEDVDEMIAAGAVAVEIATVSMLRPWRLRKIIKQAETLN